MCKTISFSCFLHTKLFFITGRYKYTLKKITFFIFILRDSHVAAPCSSWDDLIEMASCEFQTCYFLSMRYNTVSIYVFRGTTSSQHQQYKSIEYTYVL
jgi:hypothetical protein